MLAALNKHPAKYLLWVCLLLGVALRFAEYIAEPSFSVDEAITIRKTTSSSLATLTHMRPAAFEDMLAYPVGFLWVTKLAIHAMGINEISLRLFPFLSNILSLFLFAKIARKVLDGRWAIAAVFIFATAPKIIGLCYELKPLASDILFSLLCYLILIKLTSERLTLKNIVLCGLGGLISIYFSLTAIFVLASAAAYLFFRYAAKRQKNELRIISSLAFIWLTGYSLYYFISLRYFTGDPALMDFWGSYFIPSIDRPARILQWFAGIFHFFLRKFMLMSPGLAGLLILTGAVSFAVKKRDYLFIFLAPIILLLILSGLKLYPFGDRTTIFLIPVFILLIAEGIGATSNHINPRFRAIIQCMLVVLLLARPLMITARQFLNPWGGEEIKPVLGYIHGRMQAGDSVAVFRGAKPAYDYYAPKFKLPEEIFVLQINNLIAFQAKINNLSTRRNDKRVWLVFTHMSRMFVQGGMETCERRYIIERLNTIGRELDEFVLKVRPLSLPYELQENVTAAVYLYDFTPRSAIPTPGQ